MEGTHIRCSTMELFVGRLRHTFATSLNHLVAPQQVTMDGQ